MHSQKLIISVCQTNLVNLSTLYFLDAISFPLGDSSDPATNASADSILVKKSFKGAFTLKHNYPLFLWPSNFPRNAFENNFTYTCVTPRDKLNISSLHRSIFCREREGKIVRQIADWPILRKWPLQNLREGKGELNGQTYCMYSRMFSCFVFQWRLFGRPATHSPDN
jgi:hypothetical protein